MDDRVRYALEQIDYRLGRLEHTTNRILRLGVILRNMEGRLMATLDETLAEVTAESTKLDSIQALIDGIRQQLADALAGSGISADGQAKIDAIFAGLTANTAKIDRALTANTGPGGSPSPAPTPSSQP